MKPYIAVPATAALVYRAWSHKSLTPLGIVVAALTATAHAIHPWSLGFGLLCVFFLAGTRVTKIKHAIKATLTQSSTGSPGGEGARTHVQVLANSLVASLLLPLHALTLWPTIPVSLTHSRADGGKCFQYHAYPRASDIFIVGVIANYAAVAADTFSSELGILAKSQPRLITAPWKAVPKGTNGGVTIEGIAAGALGALIIGLAATLLAPFCQPSNEHYQMTPWDLADKAKFVGFITLVGTAGSLLDSLLGALLQASVIDIHTGKVIEGAGGAKVPVHSAGSFHMKQRAKVRASSLSTTEGAGAVAQTSAYDPDARNGLKQRAGGKEALGVEEPEGSESRRRVVGLDLLSNNGVNLLMAATMSVVGMLGVCVLWDVSLADVVKEVRYAARELAFGARK